MPLFMDIHKGLQGATAKSVADAHMKDVSTQKQYGVEYQRYWFDQKQGELFCLVKAPDAETAKKVHREAHGMIADEIHEVAEGK